MLTCFGDESSDESKLRVFAAAGVVGTDAAWEILDSKWAARVNGVPFHATDCESSRGEFTLFPHSDNQALYRDLTILLAESGLGGWGFAVDLASQREVFPDAPDIVYYKCFIEVVNAMKNLAANNGVQIKFVFDSRIESEHNAGILYEIFRNSQEARNHLHDGISFASSRVNQRVQVADLFARETMKALDNQIGPTRRPPRKSWLALFETKRFHIEAVSKEWFESLKANMHLAEKALGMSQDGYQRFLLENKLQHNTTNLIRYTDLANRE